MSSSNKNYAKRLMVVSRKLDKSELFFENIKLINDAFDKNSNIGKFINSVDNTIEDKVAYLKENVSSELNDTVLVELLKMVEQSPFEYTAGNLVHDFIEEYYGDQGITFGVVYSAREIDEDQLSALQDVFSEKMGYDVVLENIVSAGLIGGVKVVIDEQIFDGTYRTKVDNLKRSLKNEDDEISETNITAKIQKSVDEFENTGVRIKSPNTTGYVTSFADGIIHIKGVNYAMASEILYVGSGKAMVMDLKEDEIAAIQLDDDEVISNGTEVSLTGRVIEVPVGDELIGRVVNALGVPIDGKGSIKTDLTAPVEVEAPGIIDRSSVNEPLETGIKMIDSMIPIGKGQRELIIGDRQTGKTAIAIDTILNQKGNNVKCIYVAIGQKNSSVAQIIDKLEQANAMSYTTVVVASASDLPALQYLAPYAGCAIGEYWMKKGEDVLIIYDDLSKHAIAYRTISLLLRRPPGREAYPGDIFYLHSRLLERSGKLSKELGMGSLTALPIIETQAGDISAYIPTNVISITDGQIFLQSDLFNSGIRPAIDYGLSVSRVGGSAQRKAMRKVSSSLKLDLSQYQEVLSFAKFGSDLDEDTRKTISHGQHLTELLKQGQYQPVPMEEMAVLLFANTIGLIDKIELDKVKLFESSLLEEMRTRYSEILDEIRESFVISEEVSEKLKMVLSEYVENFNTINN